MKIAVTATAPELDADMDPRFGRAHYFVILDDEGNILATHDNASTRNAMQGAGIQAGKFLADNNVEVLLTGHVGPNAYRTLEAAGIKVGVEMSGTVREALEAFKSGNVTFAAAPNAEAHWV